MTNTDRKFKCIKDTPFEYGNIKNLDQKYFTGDVIDIKTYEGIINIVKFSKMCGYLGQGVFKISNYFQEITPAEDLLTKMAQHDHIGGTVKYGTPREHHINHPFEKKKSFEITEDQFNYLLSFYEVKND